MTFCAKTYRRLSDEFLLDIYKKTNSVQKRIKVISEYLSNEMNLKPRKSNSIASYLVMTYMIPAGVKASIRGYRFNEIVYSYLSNIISVKKKPEILLTKESFPDCINVHTHVNEIPDWCVMNKKTKRVMIGYNQIDLWTGGAQCNRADKYLKNHALFKILEKKYKCTLVCVIAAPLPSSMRRTSKIYKILEEGFQTQRLIYVKQLRHRLQDIMLQ